MQKFGDAGERSPGMLLAELTGDSGGSSQDQSGPARMQTVKVVLMEFPKRIGMGLGIGANAIHATSLHFVHTLRLCGSLNLKVKDKLMAAESLRPPKIMDIAVCF